MASNYIPRKNRNKGGSKSSRGPPGIGFNLTDDGDYDIAGRKLVNVKQPEKPGDAVNLECLDTLRTQVNETHANMLKKDDAESVIEIVKPELKKLQKKIKKDGLTQYQENINVTATSDSIDIGNRRVIKAADAVDKTDVINKGQLDMYENRLIKLETEFTQSPSSSSNDQLFCLQFVGRIVFDETIKATEDTMLYLSFVSGPYIRIPFDAEVKKVFTAVYPRDLLVRNNKGTIDVSKPFINEGTEIMEVLIKRDKVEDSGTSGNDWLYYLDRPIEFFMFVKPLFAI